MNNDGNTKDGFLGRRFKTCDRCGELITVDAHECRFCGRQFKDDVAKPGREKYTQPPAELEFRKTAPKEEAAIPASPNTPGIFTTPSGDLIPPEYGPDFNPKAFSWNAFFFPELWHAEKGLTDRAMLHFWIRMATLIVAAFAIILMSFENTQVLGGVLILPWLIGLAATGAVSLIDARTAHERYFALYRDAMKAGSFDSIRAGALRLYWSMLLIPFCMFLVSFLVSVLSSAGFEGIGK